MMRVPASATRLEVATRGVKLVMFLPRQKTIRPAYVIVSTGARPPVPRPAPQASPSASAS